MSIRLKAAPWFRSQLEELQIDPEYVAESVILDITEQIHQAMAERDLSQRELAGRLGVTPSAVSQLLSGDQNVSIRRLVEVALALGMTVLPPRLVEREKPVIEEWPVSRHGAGRLETPAYTIEIEDSRGAWSHSEEENGQRLRSSKWTEIAGRPVTNRSRTSDPVSLVCEELLA